VPGCGGSPRAYRAWPPAWPSLNCPQWGSGLVTSSASGNGTGRPCFRISAMSCYEWSAGVRWCLSPSAAIVTQLVTRSPESSWLTVSARCSSWHLARLWPGVVVACHWVAPGWNKAGHPLPCGRSSATLLTCVFSSQYFSSYPASSRSDVPSLCPRWRHPSTTMTTWLPRPTCQAQVVPRDGTVECARHHDVQDHVKAGDRFAPCSHHHERSEGCTWQYI